MRVRLPSLPLLLRERPQPDLTRGLWSAGAERSSAETCKAEALSNAGSRRARACPLFDAMTRTHPRRHGQVPAPDRRYAGRFKGPLRNVIPGFVVGVAACRGH